MCVVLGLDAAGLTHHTDTIRPCHASDNALKPTNPSLAANHSKCQTNSRVRTRSFVPDHRLRPSEVRVSQARSSRCAASHFGSCFGFGFISVLYFVFRFGLYCQRPSANANER